MNEKNSPPRVNGNKPIQNKIANLSEKGKEISANVQEKAANLTNKMKNMVKNTTEKVGSSELLRRGNEFMEANSAISKFVFIILLLLLFVLCFNIGVWLIQTLIGSSKNPVLLNGLVSANKITKVSVNPNVKESAPIYRSINEDQGLEFTWNIWFYIDSLNAKNPSYSRIFSKGSENHALQLTMPPGCTDNSCLNVFNSSPGLFITQKKQNDAVFPNTRTPTIIDNRVNLILLINTYKPSQNNQQYAESITIENIPIQKWVCTTIRVQQTTVDIYINGVLTQRKKLNNLPIQNYYDVLIGDNTDGFTGSISSLRYFNKAVGYDEIQNLFAKGPNLKSLETSGLSPNGTDYISMNWYYK
jgi:hypothetical protein